MPTDPLVEAKLQKLGLRSLLFLSNIEEIRWETPDNIGHYYKTTKPYSEKISAKGVTIVANADGEETLQDYIVIFKEFQLEGKELKVEIAYKKIKEPDSEKEIIVPVQDPKLVVYFPTERVTFLKFLVQGPYKTTPNRENIPLQDEQNKFITNMIAQLVAESLPIIKQLGYLDVNFLEILPLNEYHIDEDPIYAEVFESVKTALSSKQELWPTNKDTFSSGDDVLLARGRELTRLFVSDDIENLFSRKNWLDTNITLDLTKELRDYVVTTVEIQEVPIETIARRLTDDFMTTKSDNWVVEFYTYLIDQPALWRDAERHPYRSGVLRTKPIIRLEDGSHVAPFDEYENLQAYLPSDMESQYPTVRRSLIENSESAVKFLKELGFTTPDIYAEIRKYVLPRYQGDKISIDDQVYLEDLQKLLIAFGKGDSQKRRDLLSDLRKLPVIKARNLFGVQSFLEPGDVYLNNEDLQIYFQGFDEAFFLDEGINANYQETDLFEEFLDELGLVNVPRRIQIEAELSKEEKKNLLKKAGYSIITHELPSYDYELEGLKFFFSKAITIKRSKALWNLLLEKLATGPKYQARKILEGEYNWMRYVRCSQGFDAKFVHLLQNEAWLFDKLGQLKKPYELLLSDLAQEYNRDIEYVDVLLEKFRFKSEIIDQLPEHEKNILEITKGFTLEELEQALANFSGSDDSESTKPSDWIPDVDPEEVPANFGDATLIGLDYSGLIYPTLDPDDGDQDDDQDDGIDEKRKSKSTKAIGQWGEQYVFKALKSRVDTGGTVVDTDYGCRISYGHRELDIYWFNRDQDTGVGYDFLIKQGNEIIEYIEVKSTEESSAEFIPITGTQWGVALELFHQNEGDKYVIYRVLNSGKPNAKILQIPNPVKLWRDGKLLAHPVNLKL